MYLVFGLGISKGCSTTLWNFQGWHFVLCGISKKMKNSRGFFKKVCPQPPLPCFFSGIVQVRKLAQVSKFFRTTGFQLKLLILIELSNIFHWKPGKKKKVVVVLRQNVAGPN